MTTVLDLIGWPLGLLLAAVAIPLLARTLRNPQSRGDRGNWITICLFSCAAVADFTAVGLLSLLTGILLAVSLLGVFLLLAKPWQQGRRRELGMHAAFGKDWLVRDTLTLWDRLRGHAGRSHDAKPEAVPLEAAAVVTAARGIPPVLQDPHLGPAIEPGEIAASPAQAPAPYVQLAQFIAGFEPADDMELRMFMESNATGSVLVADAWHAFADTCLNGVGLDPAYVAGVMEAGDSSAGHGSLLAQIHKRFGVIYGAVKEWISGHGPLPKNAREWLTGDL